MAIRSRLPLVHGLRHRLAGRGNQVVEFFLPTGVEQFVPPERGHHVDEAVDRLDERGVAPGQAGRWRLAESVFGGSERA